MLGATCARGVPSTGRTGQPLIPNLSKIDGLGLHRRRLHFDNRFILSRDSRQSEEARDTPSIDRCRRDLY